MTAAIVDGRARFGVSMVDFYRQEQIALMVGRRGVLVPPITEVADEAEPALAFVNALPDGSARWIARCPACLRTGRTSVEYVWLATPWFFCVRCGNVELQSRWRPVRMPTRKAEIERLLLLRPDPETRNWNPEESIQDLLEQNALLGIGG